MSKVANNLILSEEDYRKLSALVAACKLDLVASLEEELGKATVVPDGLVPENTVSMHSSVQVLDLDSGVESDITLVYPHEADSAEHKVSVLAPMGAALIGLRVGHEYQWEMPNGKKKRFLVKSVQARGSRAVGA